MKLNQNHFGVSLEEPLPPGFSLMPGESKQLALRCTLSNPGGPAPQRPPVLIQAGIKCSLDLFYFTLPALLQVLLSPSKPEFSLGDLWRQHPVQPECRMQLPSVSPQLGGSWEALCARLHENRIFYINHSKKDDYSGGDHVIYVCCGTEHNPAEVVAAEITIPPAGGITIAATSQKGYMSLLFLQAVKFVLQANHH
jgi:hypothetical protein